MWELTFMGALVLAGVGAGYSIRAAHEPRLTANQIAEVVAKTECPVTVDDDEKAALRALILAALDEHRDKAVARVSRRITKSGKRKAVR